MTAACLALAVPTEEGPQVTREVVDQLDALEEDLADGFVRNDSVYSVVIALERLRETLRREYDAPQETLDRIEVFVNYLRSAMSTAQPLMKSRDPSVPGTPPPTTADIIDRPIDPESVRAALPMLREFLKEIESRT
jgi:hypothetical protein